VAEATVVGIDDPFEGQAIKACIVLREGAALTVEQIRRHCRANLEAHMVPKFVELFAELPKTPSGKIRKRDLQHAPS
jgi:acyl-coenzyme A synthetase/AMP-(fatty) acid ligase